MQQIVETGRNLSKSLTSADQENTELQSRTADEPNPPPKVPPKTEKIIEAVVLPPPEPASQVRVIRVFAGNVNFDATFNTVSISDATTAEELTELALSKFRARNVNPHDFYISICYMDSYEKKLAPDDNITAAIDKLKTKNLPGVSESARASFVFTHGSNQIRRPNDNIFRFILNRNLVDEIHENPNTPKSEPSSIPISTESQSEKSIADLSPKTPLTANSNVRPIRVMLKGYNEKEEDIYRTIPVSISSTVDDVLELALDAFDIPRILFDSFTVSAAVNDLVYSPLGNDLKLDDILGATNVHTSDALFTLKQIEASPWTARGLSSVDSIMPREASLVLEISSTLSVPRSLTGTPIKTNPISASNGLSQFPKREASLASSASNASSNNSSAPSPIAKSPRKQQQIHPLRIGAEARALSNSSAPLSLKSEMSLGSAQMIAINKSQADLQPAVSRLNSSNVFATAPYDTNGSLNSLASEQSGISLATNHQLAVQTSIDPAFVVHHFLPGHGVRSNTNQASISANSFMYAKHQRSQSNNDVVALRSAQSDLTPVSATSLMQNIKMKPIPGASSFTGSSQANNLSHEGVVKTPGSVISPESKLEAANIANDLLKRFSMFADTIVDKNRSTLESKPSTRQARNQNINSTTDSKQNKELVVTSRNVPMESNIQIVEHQVEVREFDPRAKDHTLDIKPFIKMHDAYESQISKSDGVAAASRNEADISLARKQNETDLLVQVELVSPNLSTISSRAPESAKEVYYTAPPITDTPNTALQSTKGYPTNTIAYRNPNAIYMAASLPESSLKKDGEKVPSVLSTPALIETRSYQPTIRSTLSLISPINSEGHSESVPKETVSEQPNSLSDNAEPNTEGLARSNTVKLKKSLDVLKQSLHEYMGDTEAHEHKPESAGGSSIAEDEPLYSPNAQGVVPGEITIFSTPLVAGTSSQDSTPYIDPANIVYYDAPFAAKSLRGNAGASDVIPPFQSENFDTMVNYLDEMLQDKVNPIRVQQLEQRLNIESGAISSVERIKYMSFLRSNYTNGGKLDGAMNSDDNLNIKEGNDRNFVNVQYSSKSGSNNLPDFKKGIQNVIFDSMMRDSYRRQSRIQTANIQVGDGAVDHIMDDDEVNENEIWHKLKSTEKILIETEKVINCYYIFIRRGY